MSTNVCSPNKDNKNEKHVPKKQSTSKPVDDWVDVSQEYGAHSTGLEEKRKEQKGDSGFEIVKTYGNLRSMDKMILDLSLDETVTIGIRQPPENHLKDPRPYPFVHALYNLLLSFDQHCLLRFLRFDEHRIFHFLFVRTVGSSLMKINIFREAEDVTIAIAVRARGEDFERNLSDDGQTLGDLLPAYMTIRVAHRKQDVIEGWFPYKWDACIETSVAKAGVLPLIHSYAHSYRRPWDHEPRLLKVNHDNEGQDTVRQLAGGDASRFLLSVATKSCYMSEQKGGEHFVAVT